MHSGNKMAWRSLLIPFMCGWVSARGATPEGECLGVDATIDGPGDSASLERIAALEREVAELRATLANRQSVKLISWWPRVFRIRGLVSEDEAAGLIDLARGKTRRSTHMGNQGKHAEQLRTSSTWWVPPKEEEDNQLLRKVVERIHTAVMLPLHHGEPVQFVHYAEGEKYEFHSDTDARLARLATVLLYLNTVPDGGGGETLFPFVPGPNTNGTSLPPPLNPRAIAAGGGIRDIAPYCREGVDQFLKVKPIVGDALIFFPMSPGLRLDEGAWHAACPVKAKAPADGKWVLQRWIKWQSKKGKFYVGPP